MISLSYIEMDDKVVARLLASAVLQTLRHQFACIHEAVAGPLRSVS